MERLTERFSNGQAMVYGCGNNCKYDFKYCNNHLEDCPTIDEIYEKLATYEDLEEQGKLLKLPCEIGHKVYMIYQFCGEGAWEIEEHKIRLEDLEDISKTVFLTKEEAEKALKERRKINR